MEELIILKFQAKAIEDAIRLTMKLKSKNEPETAYDRVLANADKFIKEVLAKSKTK